MSVFNFNVSQFQFLYLVLRVFSRKDRNLRVWLIRFYPYGMRKLNHVRSDGADRATYIRQIQDIAKHVIATKIKQAERAIHK